MLSSDVIGPYSQTLFLGASIIRFTSKIGWNGDQGEVQVELVEDTCRGAKVFYDSYGNANLTNQPDFFNPPRLGSPVFFKFGNFTFGGILQNWEQTASTGEGRTFSLRLTDPIDILAGTQVIINNYTGGVFGVPNLINAFGYNETLYGACNVGSYLESLNPPMRYTPGQGFGGANVGRDGMSWHQIKNALGVLVNSPSSFYGGSLRLRDTHYYLDLSELPTFDANFRIQGDNTTIMDLVGEVCKAASLDYFVELLYYAPGTIPAGYGGIWGHLHPDVYKFIKIRTASRFYQRPSAYNVDLTVNSPIEARLNLGKISQFVGNGSGRSRSNRGLELRHDVTNSFLVGDNRQDLWQQPYTGSGNTYTDTIWPYWGKDQLGFPIISNGYDNDHNFTLSTAGWGADIVEAVGATYNITLYEMRAAMDGMESWLNWMEVHKTDMATDLKIDASFIMDARNLLLGRAIGAGVPGKPDDMIDWRKIKADIANEMVKNADTMQKSVRLFNIVKSYAEMAGRKFMVALPLICAANDDSSPYAVRTNWMQSDGAWTESVIQLHALAPALAPASPVVEVFRKPEDGRIEAFMFFHTGGSVIIDYSQCSPEEVIPISNFSCFVRATVEEITFLNPLAPSYPRAIVSINTPVFIKTPVGDEADAPIIDGLRAMFLGDEAFRERLAERFGDDKFKLGLGQMPLMPLGAAVPLKSNNLSYGPWITTYSFGPAAKTNYERNTSFNPWNFGAAYVMNYAGQIVVETQVTQQVVSEAGSFTIPGIPPTRLGNVLLAGGPEVTNVDVSVSRDGVSTSVRMRTWVPNFGELGKRNVDLLAKAGTYYRGLQRAFNMNAITPGVGGFVGNYVRMLNRSDRFNRNSSHSIIAGEYIEDPDNEDLKRVNIVITEGRKLLPEVKNGYENKAFMGLEGLFRPYATYEHASLPHLEDGELSRALDFCPFKHEDGGHTTEIIARGDYNDITNFNIKQESETFPTNSDYRAIGLAAPLILVGWGEDVNGRPVPNADPDNPTDEWIENYQKKPELWKAGPLLVKWDDDQKGWAAGGTSTFRAKMLTTLSYRGSASARTFINQNDVDASGAVVNVHDWMLPQGGTVSPGTNIMYIVDNGKNFVSSAGCTSS